MKRLKSKAGFTLVELVVVIAIMAILAGVGTVGYGAYIKSANKGADKTLVGNIVRSIETGINSYAFPLDEVLQMAQENETSTGGLAVPLGFVVVTEEGTKVYVATSADKSEHNTEDCVHAKISEVTENGKVKYYIVDDEGNKAENNSPLFDKTKQPSSNYEIISNKGAGYKNANELVYEIDLTNIASKEICLTHSHISTEEINHSKKGGFLGSKWEDTQKIINFNNSDFVPWGSCGETKYDKYGTVEVGEADDTHSLAKTLIASFGADYNQPGVLALKGDWSKTEASITSYWSNSKGMLQKVKDLSGLLNSFITANNAIVDPVTGKLPLGSLVGNANGTGVTVTLFEGTTKSADLIAEKHDSQTDIVNDIANKIVNDFTENEFVAKWKNFAENGTGYGKENFGVSGREFYSAVRIGFNSAFASYINNSACGHSAYVSDFGRSAVGLVTEELGMGDNETVEKILTETLKKSNIDVSKAKLPYVICKSILVGNGGTVPVDSNCPLKEAENLDSFCYCTTCKDNFEYWIKSGTCENDARAFYQTMKSVSNLPTEIKNDADYFDYCESYMNAFKELYTKVQNEINSAKSVVVIEVYYDDGEFKYNVSPVEANPRKK